MARFFKRRTETKGKAPGALVFIGRKKMDQSLIRLFHYNNEVLTEKQLESLEEALPYLERPGVNWINIDGVHDTSLIEKAGKLFAIHSLAQEDIMNTDQRARFEDYDDHLFVAMKMLEMYPDRYQVDAEHISFVIAKNFVLTFQERKGDVFEAVRQRIRNKHGRLRRVGNDYLAYALMDTIVDNYIYLTESLGEKIESLELKVIGRPGEMVLEEINNYKRELHYVSKLVKPAREMIKNLQRSPSSIIEKKTQPFLKDLTDIITQVTENLDTFRVLLSDFLNTYHMSLSNRMNDIMKTLTIFSAIFIPLTFIAGVYGMNFEYMPGLESQKGYFLTMIGMAGIGAGMAIFLRYKGWF